MSEVTSLTWRPRTADLTRQEMSRHFCLYALLALLLDPAVASPRPLETQKSTSVV